MIENDRNTPKFYFNYPVNIPSGSKEKPVNDLSREQNILGTAVIGDKGKV
jgi:hypothetical protein